MERKSKNNAKKKPFKKGQTSTGRTELPIKALQYFGPVRTPDVLRQQDCYTTVLQIDGVLSSDGAGQFNPVFSSSPNAPGGGLSACPGWSSLAAVFDEFRTLAFEIEFLSVYDQLISGASNVLTTVLDYDVATALGAYGTADNYGSQKNFSIQEYDGKVKKRKILMSGPENSGFTNTGAPASLFWIKCYAASLALSSQVVHMFVRYRVQFRGRGI